MSMRTGVRLGLDVGTVRIGVARSDERGIVCLPVETVHVQRDHSEIDDLLDIIDEYDPIEIVVGLPRHLKGTEGQNAHMARSVANRIAARWRGGRICMVDERLTSNQAHSRLRDSKVETHRHREMVDQVAAQIILELALESERISGTPPGQTVSLGDPSLSSGKAERD